MEPEDLPMLKTYVVAQTFIANAKDRLAKLGRDEDGAALIEYSLLIGLIAVAAITAISGLSGKIGTAWTTLNSNWK
jgi:pilus assembly protein Flp/PilA